MKRYKAVNDLLSAIFTVFVCIFIIAVYTSAYAGGKGNTVMVSSESKDKELKKLLTKEQYYVTVDNGTEPPFRNAYWNHKEEGIYVDVISGEALFISINKFNSGTGWPSFTKPIDNGHIIEKADKSLGMERTEVRSKKSNAHLGHVFDDGPAPTGKRYCINSASLHFIPVDKMEQEGYGRYLKLFQEEK